MECFYSLQDKESGVTIDLNPFPTFVIHVTGMFQRDELLVYQCGDVIYFLMK